MVKELNFRLVQIGRNCRRQKKCDRKIEICDSKGNIVGIGEPAFSPFSTMFSKAFFEGSLKARKNVKRNKKKDGGKRDKMLVTSIIMLSWNFFNKYFAHYNHCPNNG